MNREYLQLYKMQDKSGVVCMFYVRPRGMSRLCCTASVCTSTGSVARQYLCKYSWLYFHLIGTTRLAGQVACCM